MQVVADVELKSRQPGAERKDRMTRRTARCSLITAFAILGCYGAAGVSAATKAQNVCAAAGVTNSMVKKIFGVTATIDPAGVSRVDRCPIEAGVGSKPPTDCQEGSKTCTSVIVELQPASNFPTDITANVSALDLNGRASKTPVSGAGSGAVLLRSTNYGGESNPSVLFQAGSYTVIVEGPYEGVAQTPAIYFKWEALARAIHTQLG
jgi:hypothetical protein